MIEAAQEPINFWCRRISFSYLQGSYPKEPFWKFDADNCSASFLEDETDYSCQKTSNAILS